jgi:hypothetical protein
MSVRLFLTGLAFAGLANALGPSQVYAQGGNPAPSDPLRTTWRSADGLDANTSGVTQASAVLSRTETPTRGARLSSGNGTLPNQHGQVWREYDISPYTARVTSTERPEQAIVDWVLRETGYEAWHSEPLGILSANRRTIYVYHTPEMQAVVADLVDRFVDSEAETGTFCLRVATVDHPNWRSKAHRLLRPVPVQTPGVQAWLLQKEDAALLLAELSRRNDFREHSSPHLMVNNGQSTIVSAVRGRPYVSDVALRSDMWPGFEAEMGQIDEGFCLEFSPLLSLNRQMIDATIKCDVDQVEKMVPVMLDVPTSAAPRQRTKIEVPQMTHFRFHERFRWPVDQVLLVSMGMVAVPVPVDSQPLVPGLPLPLSSSVPRADLLIFVDAKGRRGEAPRVTRTAQDEARSYQGRY